MLAVECHGKTPYLAYDHAKKRIKNHKLRLHHKGRQNMLIYRCPRCRYWHVGGGAS